jgi:hypothetical protein
MTVKKYKHCIVPKRVQVTTKTTNTWSSTNDTMSIAFENTVFSNVIDSVSFLSRVF